MKMPPTWWLATTARASAASVTPTISSCASLSRSVTSSQAPRIAAGGSGGGHRFPPERISQPGGVRQNGCRQCRATTSNQDTVSHPRKSHRPMHVRGIRSWGGQPGYVGRAGRESRFGGGSHRPWPSPFSLFAGLISRPRSSRGADEPLPCARRRQPRGRLTPRGGRDLRRHADGAAGHKATTADGDPPSSVLNRVEYGDRS